MDPSKFELIAREHLKTTYEEEVPGVGLVDVASSESHSLDSVLCLPSDFLAAVKARLVVSKSEFLEKEWTDVWKQVVSISAVSASDEAVKSDAADISLGLLHSVISAPSLQRPIMNSISSFLADQNLEPFSCRRFDMSPFSSEGTSLMWKDAVAAIATSENLDLLLHILFAQIVARVNAACLFPFFQFFFDRVTSWLPCILQKPWRPTPLESHRLVPLQSYPQMLRNISAMFDCHRAGLVYWAQSSRLFRSLLQRLSCLTTEKSPSCRPA